MLKWIFIVCFAVLFTNLSAQVFKVGDVNCTLKSINYNFNPICPPHVSSTDYYSIDVDGDLSPDISIRSTCGWYFANPWWINTKEIGVSPTTTNTNSQLVSDGMGGIKNVPFGTPMNNSLTWLPTSGYLYGSGTNPYYVCFRKILTGDTVNCWISIDFSSYPGKINSYALSRTSYTTAPQPPVTPTFVITSSIMCKGDSVILNANPSGGQFSGLGVVGNEFNSGSLVAGTYTVNYTLTNAELCSSSTAITFSVNPLPIINFSQSPYFKCVDDIFILSITPSGGSINYTGNGLLGTTFYCSQAGVGTHTLGYSYTDGNGCSKTSTTNIVIDPCVGINEIDNLNSSINIFPNPAANKITISVGEYLKDRKVNCEIISVEGKLLKSILITQSETEVDISTISAGIYFVEVNFNNNKVRKKLIITR